MVEWVNIQFIEDRKNKKAEIGYVGKSENDMWHLELEVYTNTMKSLYQEIMDLDYETHLHNYEEIRSEFIKLLNNFKPYMDKHFMTEIKKDNQTFHQRFFEAYIGNVLLNSGLSFTSKSKGPDFIIEEINTYIECIAPLSGESKNEVEKEYVKTKETDFKANDVPAEKIMLRLTSALKSKIDKFRKYKNENCIDNGSYVIAINDGNIPYSEREDRIPRIVKVLYGVGYEIVSFDGINNRVDSTNKIIVNSMPELIKNEQLKINKAIFCTEEFSDISGVIFSSAQVKNLENPLGYDILLIKNPYAVNPIKDIEKYVKFYKVYYKRDNN